MANSEQQLREAFALMKEGKTNEAGRIVQDVIHEDKTNVRAWWMMANLVDDPSRKKIATEKVLGLDPTHPGAVKLMSEIDPSYVPPRKIEIQRRIKQRQTQTTRAVDGEYDFSKLGDTDPALEPEHEEDRSDLRVATLAMSAIGILILVAISIAIFFQIQSDGLDLSFLGLGGSPETVVDDYFAALAELDFDRMAELSCAADKDEIQAAAAELEQNLATPGADLSELTLDTSGLTTTITERTADRAVVQIGGELTMSFQGLSMSFDVEQLTDGTIGSEGVVIRENGRWLVCSE